MDPLLLDCIGCGAHLRVRDRERARTRHCPRCATPLAGALDHAWPIEARTPSRGRLGLIVGTATILGLASLVHLLSVLVAPPGPARDGRSSLARVDGATPDRHPGEPRHRPTAAPAAPAGSSDGAAAPADPDASAPEWPDPAPVVGASAPVDLALRTGGDGAPAGPPPAARPPGGRSTLVADRQKAGPLATPPPAPPPAAPAPPVPPAPATTDPAPASAPLDAPPRELRRFLVRDAAGRAVVAREHGTTNERVAVILPDGSIGWPINEVPTDEPFRPSTIDALEQALLDGEYATSRVVRTAHYLVFYQSTERFARDSADLLEDLYDKLTLALRKQKLPVSDAEFPLVAVIFRSEDDFRANRRVAPDVQAYYEILSNRIFFFEKGRRDAAAPEVAALRKPQTVAHEGTHQLLHNVGIQPRMSDWPLWLVEGLAEYCSPPRATRKGVDWAGLGQINAIHLTTIRDLADPMSSSVRGGPRAPAARESGQPLAEYLATRTDLTPTDYALSWGLTHYLAQKQTDQFVSYIRRLNRLRPFETRTPEEQLADFRAAFGDDLAQLGARVDKHLAHLKVPNGQALPFYAVHVQQPGPGNTIRRMSMVSQSPEMIRQWVETAGVATNGMIQWEAIPYPTRTPAMRDADDWVHPSQ